MKISTYGWQTYIEHFPELESQNPDISQIARVAVQNKTDYTLYSEQGEITGTLRGKALKTAKQSSDFPRVGDWVKFSIIPGDKHKFVIEEVLPRYSIIKRDGPWDKGEQVIATNIDTVFIVQGVDNNFDIRRLERYIITVQEGHAKPVVILNNADLVQDLEKFINEARGVSGQTEVVAISAKTKLGIEQLKSFLAPETTVAFLGSSGVGKSTLINILAGTGAQETREVREKDSRGRHTTTRREMILMPSGAILIDTPGIRELGVLASQETLNNVFAEIEKIAQNCEYNDCDHEKSDGCAVKSAVQTGEISEERYQGYLKLLREIRHNQAKKLSSEWQDRKRHKRGLRES